MGERPRSPPVVPAEAGTPTPPTPFALSLSKGPHQTPPHAASPHPRRLPGESRDPEALSAEGHPHFPSALNPPTTVRPEPVEGHVRSDVWQSDLDAGIMPT